MMRLLFFAGLLFAASLLGMIGTGFASASNYSSGSYGACTYDTCSLTLASGATVNVNITPVGGSTRCSVQSNTVTATTDSSTGYLVTINNGDTSTTLNGPSGNTISSTSGTAASPVALTANTWGYRVDGIAGFGAGPTSSASNAAIPSLSFAATPSSAAGGATIRSTTTADGTPYNSSVWYGVCVDTSKPAGAYADGVTYTATVNP